MAKYGEAEILLPPLDIAWIWHVHMLSPIKYHEDCKTITGRCPQIYIYLVFYRSELPVTPVEENSIQPLVNLTISG